MRRPTDDDIAVPLSEGVLIHQNGEGEFIGRRQRPMLEGGAAHHHTDRRATGNGENDSLSYLSRALLLRLPWMHVSMSYHAKEERRG